MWGEGKYLFVSPDHGKPGKDGDFAALPDGTGSAFAELPWDLGTLGTTTVILWMAPSTPHLQGSKQETCEHRQLASPRTEGALSKR